MLRERAQVRPGTADLLYDRAMVAEKIDKFDVVEADLRKVIELKPEHAHAYNALGYTFAERNHRLDEAYTLVQKALSLSPELPVMGALGVRPLLDLLAGRLSRTEAVDQAKAETRQYQKRQLTWIRRRMADWQQT